MCRLLGRWLIPAGGDRLGQVLRSHEETGFSLLDLFDVSQAPIPCSKGAIGVEMSIAKPS